MKISESTYKQMPSELKSLFIKLPNCGSEEVLALMPTTMTGDLNKVNTSIWGNAGGREGIGHKGDSGSAARFFKQCEWSEDDCINVNTAEKSLSLQEQVEDFVLRLVATRVLPEGNVLRNTIQPFIQEMRTALKQPSENDTQQMKDTAEKCLQELRHMNMEKLSANPANCAEIQELISTMTTIQSLLNTGGFVEAVMSNSMLSNMVLGEAAYLPRFNYCAKASKRDRDEGCEGVITWEGVDLKSEMLELRELLKGISVDMMQELANVEWNTIWSGKKLPYPASLRDMSFITSTGLKMTIDLKTLSACPSLNTSDFIRAVLEMSKVDGLSLATTAASIDLLKQATTSVQMASALDAVVAVLTLLWKIKERGRQGNGHATVKPTSLMRYLCRLITPPNGIVLDPFMGSGSTGKAAVLEGFRFMGLDITEEYMPIAEARVKWAEKNVGMGIEEDEGEEREARKDDGVDSTLF